MEREGQTKVTQLRREVDDLVESLEASRIEVEALREERDERDEKQLERMYGEMDSLCT